MLDHPVVACDFDDTLTHWAFPDCGAPRENVIEAVRLLKAEGWEVVIHTCRVNSFWEEPDRSLKVEDMLKWLLLEEVPFGAVWGLDIARAVAPATVPIPELGDWHITTTENDILLWRYGTETGKPLADAYICDATVNPLFASRDREPTAEEIADSCRLLLARRSEE